jgi:hypothetical protein
VSWEAILGTFLRNGLGWLFFAFQWRINGHVCDDDLRMPDTRVVVGREKQGELGVFECLVATFRLQPA